tara:strand:+ start:436 stop:735 length:300 start_codon:yes stop_codon:yes gene_type:complete
MSYFFNIFSDKNKFLFANNNFLPVMSGLLKLNNSSLENLIDIILNIANSSPKNEETSFINNDREFCDSEDENDYEILIDRLDKIQKTMDAISIEISEEN